MIDADVDYSYESRVIEYGENRIYTPDFVTDKYIIELKGYEYRNERKLAEIALEKLDEKQYIVVGAELPADIHIPWEDREIISELFE